MMIDEGKRRKILLRAVGTTKATTTCQQERKIGLLALRTSWDTILDTYLKDCVLHEKIEFLLAVTGGGAAFGEDSGTVVGEGGGAVVGTNAGASVGTAARLWEPATGVLQAVHLAIAFL